MNNNNVNDCYYINRGYNFTSGSNLRTCVLLFFLREPLIRQFPFFISVSTFYSKKVLINIFEILVKKITPYKKILSTHSFSVYSTILSVLLI